MACSIFVCQVPVFALLQWFTKMSNFYFLTKKFRGQTKPLADILCFCKNWVFQLWLAIAEHWAKSVWHYLPEFLSSNISGKLDFLFHCKPFFLIKLSTYTYTSGGVFVDGWSVFHPSVTKNHSDRSVTGLWWTRVCKDLEYLCTSWYFRMNILKNIKIEEDKNHMNPS